MTEVKDAGVMNCVVRCFLPGLLAAAFRNVRWSDRLHVKAVARVVDLRVENHKPKISSAPRLLFLISISAC